MPAPPLPEHLKFLREDLKRLKAIAKPMRWVEGKKFVQTLTPLQQTQLREFIAQRRAYRQNLHLRP